MSPYVDPRLHEKINTAGEDSLVDAILIVIDEGNSSCDDGGLARQVVEAATERTGDQPIAIRYLPRANAAVISAGPRLLQEILKDGNLAVASTTEIDFMDVLFI